MVPDHEQSSPLQSHKLSKSVHRYSVNDDLLLCPIFYLLSRPSQRQRVPLNFAAALCHPPAIQISFKNFPNLNEPFDSLQSLNISTSSPDSADVILHHACISMCHMWWSLLIHGSPSIQWSGSSSLTDFYLCMRTKPSYIHAYTTFLWGNTHITRGWAGQICTYRGPDSIRIKVFADNQ